MSNGSLLLGVGPAILSQTPKFRFFIKKISKSLTRKYDNHIPQTNPWLHEEEIQNINGHKAEGRQLW